MSTKATGDRAEAIAAAELERRGGGEVVWRVDERLDLHTVELERDLVDAAVVRGIDLDREACDDLRALGGQAGVAGHFRHAARTRDIAKGGGLYYSPNGGSTFNMGPEGSYIGGLMKGSVSVIDIPTVRRDTDGNHVSANTRSLKRIADIVFTVTGKNAASSGYNLYTDWVRLIKQ